MKIDLTDRVAVVTGAAGNLGSAVARAFRESGAKIALIDLTPDRLSRNFADWANSADVVLAPPTDVTDLKSVESTFGEIEGRFGRLDILVNTAGGYRAGEPLHKSSPADWDFMLNLNARSVFNTCHASAPIMLRRKYGKIINIASRAALGGDANHAAYSVSKTAVVRITESVSAELKNSGINVNCVMPGMIDTPQNREAMPNADFSKWVSLEDLANVITFLASDAARAIHGAALPVFGRG